MCYFCFRRSNLKVCSISKQFHLRLICHNILSCYRLRSTTHWFESLWKLKLKENKIFDIFATFQMKILFFIWMFKGLEVYYRSIKTIIYRKMYIQFEPKFQMTFFLIGDLQKLGLIWTTFCVRAIDNYALVGLDPYRVSFS